MCTLKDLAAGRRSDQVQVNLHLGFLLVSSFPATVLASRRLLRYASLYTNRVVLTVCQHPVFLLLFTMSHEHRQAAQASFSSELQTWYALTYEVQLSLLMPP